MEYAEQMAIHLAPRFIRVNVMHPTNVNTHLLHNDGIYGVFRPDLVAEGKKPTREDADLAFTYFQAMPIPYVEPEDIANLAVFLASDESRYITGQQIRPMRAPTSSSRTDRDSDGTRHQRSDLRSWCVCRRVAAPVGRVVELPLHRAPSRLDECRARR